MNNVVETKLLESLLKELQNNRYIYMVIQKELASCQK